MNLYDSIRNFIKKIDAKSWPAFFMFALVLLAAGGLNYLGMEPTFGWFVAVTVAAFFGVGVLSWHIVESRTDDSEYQEQTAQVAKWITVGLDAILLLVNFARIENGKPGWDITAYVIIALAAATHVICYLLWTQASDTRKINRERERALNVIARQGNKSKTVIATTEKKLEVHQWVVDEEKRLREKYSDLESALVNRLVNEMRRDAYAKLDELDGKPQTPQARPQERPQSTQRLEARNSFASEAERAKLADSPTRGGK